MMKNKPQNNIKICLNKFAKWNSLCNF